MAATVPASPGTVVFATASSAEEVEKANIYDQIASAAKKMYSPAQFTTGRADIAKLAIEISSVRHLDCKLKALDLLAQFLVHDPLIHSKASGISTAEGLVEIAIDLMETLNPETAKTVMHGNLVLEKLVPCYALVIEGMLVHYGMKHMPAIKEKLQLHLAVAEETLEKLCRDQAIAPILNACAQAQEGIKRLKTDQRVSEEVVKRLGKLSDVVKHVAEKNLTGALRSLRDTVDGLEKKVTHKWYALWLSCMAMARQIPANGTYDLVLPQLQALHFCVVKHRTEDWNFTYGAINILGRIAMQAEDPKMRHAVVLGDKPGDPSLVSFLQFRKFKKKARLVGKEAAKQKDLHIRQCTAETLKYLLKVRESDTALCLGIKFHLIGASLDQRMHEGEEKEMLETMAFIPQDPHKILQWVMTPAAALVSTAAESARAAPVSTEAVELPPAPVGTALASPAAPGVSIVAIAPAPETGRREADEKRATVLRHSFEGLTYSDEQFRTVVLAPDVQGISLKNCAHLTDASLAGLAPYSSLTDLNMECCKTVNGSGFAALSRLTFRVLNLRESGIVDRNLQFLVGMPLQELNLEGTSVSGVGLREIARMTTLRVLNLWGTAMRDSDIEQLEKLRLDEFYLGCEGVTDRAVMSVSSMPLHTFYLCFSQVTNLALTYLRGKPLRSLSLRKTAVTYLQDLTRMPLEFLNLSGTEIRNEQLGVLRDMPLRELLLRRCESLTNGAISYLLPLKGLQKLDLSENKVITDEVVPLLCQLKQLRHLDIRKTGISLAKVGELRAALPGCKIEDSCG